MDTEKPSATVLWVRGSPVSRVPTLSKICVEERAWSVSCCVGEEEGSPACGGLARGTEPEDRPTEREARRRDRV